MSSEEWAVSGPREEGRWEERGGRAEEGSEPAKERLLLFSVSFISIAINNTFPRSRL